MTCLLNTIFLLLPLLIYSSEVAPPHCALVSEGHGSLTSSATQFAIGLHKTICFRLEDRNDTSTLTSLLHTVTLARIEQHHPVLKQYNFALPKVRTSCFCECESTGRCSSSDYQSEKCPYESDETHGCYRTFFGQQSNTTCKQSSPMGANLCCELKFNPFENITYTALQLDNPSTFAVLNYTSYDYMNNLWIVRENRSIFIRIDGTAQDYTLDTHENLKLGVIPFGVAHPLTSGMYFTQSNLQEEMEEIRQAKINDIADTDVNKLGWYRQNETTGRFYVPAGEHVVDDFHKAKVIDCKAQKFTSFFRAQFYVDFASANMQLLSPFPQLVKISHRGIESAVFNKSARNVIVSHADVNDLNMKIHVSNDFDGSVVFLHNSSRLGSFSGSIHIDSRSHHYINLSLTGATGKLNGLVRGSESAVSSQAYHFSVYVNEISSTNRTLNVSLPATLDKGGKTVCMRAEGETKNDSICVFLPFHEEAMEVIIEQNSQRVLIGDCKDCNIATSESFLKQFIQSPYKFVMQLSSGGSGGDWFDKAAHSIMYIVCLVILYLVITQCIIPFCQCCICPILVARITRSGERNERDERRKFNKKKHRVVDVEEAFV